MFLRMSKLNLKDLQMVPCARFWIYVREACRDVSVKADPTFLLYIFSATRILQSTQAQAAPTIGSNYSQIGLTAAIAPQCCLIWLQPHKDHKGLVVVGKPKILELDMTMTLIYGKRRLPQGGVQEPQGLVLAKVLIIMDMHHHTVFGLRACNTKVP